VSQQDIEQTVDALRKIWEWSETAHKNRIRKEYEKTAVCFPITDCPADGQRVEGKSSTEVVFHVDIEGATNGAFRHNKGKFAETFSFSIPSALMLRAYMAYVSEEAKAEYQAGTTTKSDLDKLFK
jgi:hypothetical protein